MSFHWEKTLKCLVVHTNPPMSVLHVELHQYTIVPAQINMGHMRGNTCWDLKCLLRASLRANSLLQPQDVPSERVPAHLNFLDGSWSSICLFQSCCLVKSFEQWGHTWGRSFLCVNIWVLTVSLQGHKRGVTFYLNSLWIVVHNQDNRKRISWDS